MFGSLKKHTLRRGKKMRNFKKILVAAVSVAALTSGTANAAVSNLPANAAVVPPVTLAIIQNLQFGFVYSGTAATVRVAPIAAPVQPVSPATAVPAVTNTGTRVLTAAASARVLKGHTSIALQNTAEPCTAIMRCQAGILQVIGGGLEAINTVSFAAPTAMTATALALADYGVAVTAATGTAPNLGLAATFARAPTTLVLNAAGAGALHIGGDLVLGAAVGSGGWQGTVPITVDY
jgi:hypothetical protein